MTAENSRVVSRFQAAVLALLVATPTLAEPPEADPPAPPPTATPGGAVERTVMRSDRTAVVEMRVAALIMSGQQGGALPIAIAEVPDGQPCDEDAPCRSTAWVEIDGTALLEEAGKSNADSLSVGIFAYVLGTELDVLERQTLELELDLERDRGLLANTGLKAFLPLELAPGEHQLRILVHAGEAFGLRGLDLHAGSAVETPDAGTPDAGTPDAGTPDAEPRIQTPVFHELIGPWLVAAAADVEIPLPPPFGLEAPSPLPSARPQMPAAGTISAQVFIAHAAPVGMNDPTDDLVALVRRAGGEPVTSTLTLGQRAVAGNLESVAVSFSAPPSVGAGSWEIAVAMAADGEAAGHDGARSSFVPIFIEQPSSPVTVAGSGSSTSQRGVRQPRPLTGTQRKLARAAGDAYRQALRQLAAGDSRAAMETLIASEAAVAQALDADAVDLLAQAESQVLVSLPDPDWGCLLPVILLHLDLSRTYRETSRNILAHHATRMTVDLTAAYARKLATPEAATEAAQTFSSLAGYFQQRGARTRATRLFARALDLAEDDAALLGLGTLYEKQGLFDQAVPVLERFAAEQPEHAEGALRLALNRARTGHTQAARDALGELVSRPANDWVTLLAHQELARLLIDQERQADAADLLRRGLARWPSHPTLQLQLAWLLDARDDSDASLKLLESVVSPGTYPAGERSRYNRWPGDRLAAGRRVLAETARDRLPELERWVSSQSTADNG